MIRGMCDQPGDPETVDLGTLHPRRYHNDPAIKEARGAKALLSERDIRRLERIMWRNRFEGRTLTWEALAEEAGLSGRDGKTVSGKTIQRALGQLGWRHCVAYRKPFLSQKLKNQRVKWAKDMLEKYPNPEDWDRVRFSDKVHFSFGPQGRFYILRKPGERNCPDCIQEQEDKKRRTRKGKQEEEEEGGCRFEL